MSKKILEELEFEKNKREILKQSKKSNRDNERVLIKQGEPKHYESIQNETNQGETKKYAWEYELENYRKSKAMDKFHTFGAICGIIALVVTLLINWEVLIQILKKILS